MVPAIMLISYSELLINDHHLSMFVDYEIPKTRLPAASNSPPTPGHRKPLPRRRSPPPPPIRYVSTGGLIDSFGKNKLTSKFGRHLISSLFGGSAISAGSANFFMNRDSSSVPKQNWLRSAPASWPAASSQSTTAESPSLGTVTPIVGRINWPKPVLVIKEYEEYSE